MTTYIGFYLALYLLANFVVVGLWDLYATLIARDLSITVSFFVRQWAHDFPIGTLAIGILIGHLVWPGGNNGSPVKKPVDTSTQSRA